MPKQEYIGYEKSDLINCNDLKCGELGEIRDSITYGGSIITKTIYGFILIYSQNTRYLPFETNWSGKPNFTVRKLNPSEKIILSNEDS